MVATRLLPALMVASTCCFHHTSGFNLGNGIVHTRLDIHNVLDQPLVCFDDRLSVVAEKTKDTSCRSGENDIEENTLLRELPPVLQQIADERREFQVNLGKAMDTLRHDMPEILKQAPNYEIYSDDITVVDDSGVRLTGIESYKSSISFLQTFIRFWFQQRSGLQYRMVYDFCRSSIKVSWHAVLVPKMPLGKPLHVDGVSMYRLDPTSGKIVEHKFESFVINNTPVAPPYGVFSLLQQDLLRMSPQGVPAPAGI